MACESTWGCEVGGGGSPPMCTHLEGVAPARRGVPVGVGTEGHLSTLKPGPTNPTPSMALPWLVVGWNQGVWQANPMVLVAGFDQVQECALARGLGAYMGGGTEYLGFSI